MNYVIGLLRYAIPVYVVKGLKVLGEATLAIVGS